MIFCIFYKVNNLFLHQCYLKSPLPVKLTRQKFKNAKNHFIFWKEFKNTESAQLLLIDIFCCQFIQASTHFFFISPSVTLTFLDGRLGEQEAVERDPDRPPDLPALPALHLPPLHLGGVLLVDVPVDAADVHPPAVLLELPKVDGDDRWRQQQRGAMRLQFTELGTSGIFSFLFTNKTWFFAFFLKLIWPGVGFLNRIGAEIGF